MISSPDQRAGERRSKQELVVLGAILVAGLLVHGINMFDSPPLLVTGDEGIYVSQAMSLLREGRLAPFMYTYDHAPAGWIQIAAWMGLSGGPQTFGGAVFSGRAFMLVLHLALIPLLYWTARRLGCTTAWAGLCALIFAVSPLAVFYGRLVILDNIMLVWVFGSLLLLLKGGEAQGQEGTKRSRRLYALSGACFGVAFLCKESAVFLLPAFAVLLFTQRRSEGQKLPIARWLAPMLAVVSLYPAYAAFRGELLPTAIAERIPLLGEPAPHQPSLASAALHVVKRLELVVPSDNAFKLVAAGVWLTKGPLLLAGGALAAAANVLSGRKNGRLLAAGLFPLVPLAYMATTFVIVYYIALVTPFLCLNLALALNRFGGNDQPSEKRWKTPLLVAGVGVAALALVHPREWKELLVTDHNDAALQALAWIKKELPADSRIVAGQELWTDLRHGDLGKPFPYVVTHWKVAYEKPAERIAFPSGDWRDIDYFVVQGDFRKQLAVTRHPLVLEAFNNARPIRRWPAGPDTFEVWKVDKTPGPSPQR